MSIVSSLAPVAKSHQVMPIENLRIGDRITNLGFVVARRQDGVFITATVRGTSWSTVTGKGDVQDRDIVWHYADEVTVDV